MILANVAAAETLEAAQSPLIYRAHDAPSVEKLDNSASSSRPSASSCAKSERLRPPISTACWRVKGARAEALVNEVVLRAPGAGRIHHENYGHFGLNLRRYAHFTSPIRRYADLIVHRALIRALKLGDDGLSDAARRRSPMSPNASPPPSAAPWRPNARRPTGWSPPISRSISARASEPASPASPRSGCSSSSPDTGADGFIPAVSLGADYFRFDEAARALTGTRSRRDLPARRQRRGQAAGSGAVRRGAAI